MGKPKAKAPRAAQQPQKPSPFDFKTAKPKHQAANVRAKKYDVVKSRTAAVSTRKNTLAQELQSQYKSNSFVDRRFGEQNPALSYEDKMLLRFQKMRQKQVSRGDSIFNLNDDDDEIQLTHRGQTLDLDRAGDDYIGSDDEGSVDSIDEERAKDTSSLGFGGLHMKRAPQQQNAAGDDGDDMVDGEGNIASVDSMDIDSDLDEEGMPKRRKTKAEIMSEVISKSKYFRHEKQKAHEEQMDATDKLDEEYLAIKDLIESSGQNAPKKASRKGNDEEEDDFDALVAKLSAEGVTRAAPQAALKDPEAIARAEAERLYQLEKLRLKRMNNEELDDADVEAQLQLAAGNKRKRRKTNSGAQAQEENDAEDQEEQVDDSDRKRKTSKGRAAASRGADELDSDDERFLPAQSDDEEQEDQQEEGSSSDEDVDDDDDEESGEEGSDEDGDEDDEMTEQLKAHGADLADVDGNDADLPTKKSSHRDWKERQREKMLKKKQKESYIVEPNEIVELAPDAELPYVFAVPSTLAKFTTLLSNQSTERQSTILSRLITSNHPSLSPKNREKLKILHGYMLQKLTSSATALSTAELDVLITGFFELCQLMPEYSVEATRTQLSEIEERFIEKASDPANASVVPRWSDLMFFKAMAHIWPVSDRRHGIVTPLNILMGQLLSLSRVASLHDLSRVLLQVNIFHNYISPAKRYAAEPFVTLFAILSAFATQNSTKSAEEEQSSKLLKLNLNPLFLIPKGLLAIQPGGAGIPAKITVPPLSLDWVRQKNPSVASLPKSPLKQVSSEDILRLQLLNVTIQLVSQYTQTFAQAQPVVEVLLLAKSHLELVLSALKGKLPAATTESLKKLIARIADDADKAVATRRNLTLFQKKIEPLSQLTPDFDEFYFGSKRDKNEDKLRREAKKLKHKVKAEQKGAERELKRDSAFIEQERMKRKAEVDEERENKYREVMTMLQQQQAGMNLEAKIGGKKKRSVLPI